jgi:CubicO group peptidase (beta-lactamase class C family)
VKPIYELAAGPVPFRARLMNGDLTEEALQGNGAAPLGAPPSAGTQGGRTNVEFIPRILSDLRPLDRSRRTEAGHRRLDGDRQIHDLRAPEALRYHGLRATRGGSKALLRSQPLRLFAHDGAWDGKQIISAQWMIDATTVRASETYLAPGRAGPGSFGYGYLVWLLPGSGRRFALISDYGQRIFVDPSSKLVMAQTALETTQKEVMHLWAALVEQFG